MSGVDYAGAMNLFVRVSVVVGCLVAVGCTCNRTDEARRAELREQRRANQVQNARGGPRYDPGKRAKKAAIERVDVGIALLDQKKFDAGDLNPWVTVRRKVGPHRPVKNAIWMLFKGPTDAEKEKGLTLVDSEAIGFEGFTVENGVVTIQLRGGCASNGSTVSIYDHLVETMAGFPQVKSIKVLGPDGTTSTPDGDANSRPACLEP